MKDSRIITNFTQGHKNAFHFKDDKILAPGQWTGQPDVEMCFCSDEMPKGETHRT